MKTLNSLAALLCLAFPCAFSTVHASPAPQAAPEGTERFGVTDYQVKAIARGVDHIRIHMTNHFGRVADASILRIDYPNTDARLALHESYSTSRPYRKTSEVATAYHALAAINGTFFWAPGFPWNTLRWHGKDIGRKNLKGWGIAFNDKDRKLYFGTMTTNIVAAFDNIICGGSMTITNGLIAIPEAKWKDAPHPRTFIGRAEGDVIYLAIFDGRQRDYAIGVNYYEGSELMRAFGCVDGFFIDGGGSSTMVVRETAFNGTEGDDPKCVIVNRVSGIDKETGEHLERAVLDQVLVLDDKSIEPGDDWMQPIDFDELQRKKDEKKKAEREAAAKKKAEERKAAAGKKAAETAKKAAQPQK